MPEQKNIRRDTPKRGLFEQFLERTRVALRDFQPDADRHSDRCAVIVETRRHPALEPIVKNAMYFLGPGWNLHIFHGDKNKGYVRKLFAKSGARFSNLRSMDSIPEYNRLMTSASFWNKIKAEHVLIFQTDAALRRRGIEEFMAYDYVGSPWRKELPWNPSDLSGGNGGISLRSHASMMEVISHIPYRGGPEDIYFVHAMKMLGMKVAPREVCTRFGVESLFSEDPFAIHAIEKYLSPDQVAGLLDFEY